ncbi:uncharacterized protein [Macrobrachium rosenbergii]|uniref:uncharacterized protein n=1 Tax=Macrobrachium rosenbergii TaxID=79674 RepID=UPI0034D6794C
MFEGEIDDDDRISVRAGLTLFDDPPLTGTVFEGPSNLPKKQNVSTNPFVAPANPAPGNSLAPVSPFGESKEDIELSLLCKRIELKKLEFEENERARRHEVEMANLNIEMARLQGANMVSSPRGNFSDRFNLGAALKLVPVFDERNVPEFFKAFDHVATQLSWPSEMWTVLIQCRLVGKAIRVYNTLEEGIAWDYQKVKSLVLKAYDLVPEAYRLKFRNLSKQPSQSFVEFARVKEEQFDEWLKSRQVVIFAALRELMLLEEFKKACSKELRVYLEEVKAVKLSKAAQIADEFVLTHQASSSNFGHRDLIFQSARPGNVEKRRVTFVSSPDNYKTNNNDNPGKVSSGPAARVFFKNNRIGSNTTVQIRFLIDTGLARSLVLKETLKGSWKYSGNFVVLGGFPNTVVSAPLVEVRLSFPGYDKVKELAVIESLPIPGIHGILGNDMLNSKGQELFPILSMHACPVAVTTRAAAKAADLIKDDDELMLSSLEIDLERPRSVDSSSKDGNIDNVLKPDWDRLSFIEAGKKEFNFDLGDTTDLTKPRFCHFGVWKTFRKLAKCFWWHGLKSSVKQFVKECEVCQVMGKRNQIILKAPLNPNPAIGEPFAKYGLPRVIQTDCGTNFTSKVFRGKYAELAIQHITSVPYHPESQGVVERFHQTLKSILKKHCYEQGDEWDKVLPFALFALRNHPNASTSVAPFELLFGHKVRGPLEIFSEILESGRRGDVKIGEFVEDLRKRLSSAWKLAQENLSSSQAVMKSNFDRKAKARSFEPGELVLLLSMDMDNFLEPRFISGFPGRTNFLQHDVDVGSASLVKQSPYWLNPVKRDIVDKEIKYMLEHNLIQPSVSPWSSPVVLVKKLMGSSVPLSDRAREISAFVTPFGLYECKVMPFGMKNAAKAYESGHLWSGRY